MSFDEERVRDAGEVADLISTMAEQIARKRRPGVPLRLVGIRARGVPLAERLAREMAALGAPKADVGAVDITLYRDDLNQMRRWPVLRGTEILFDVDGADVVLVDDVLFTGRTIRAALNAICDLGRPSRISLAVLVDRGHRELPIEPDVVGLTLPTDRDDRVQVRLRPIDSVDEIVTIPAAPGRSQHEREERPQ